ncbi:MAG: hypothetical protein AAB416_05270 [Patescibacteria group bacterium]
MNYTYSHFSNVWQAIKQIACGVIVTNVLLRGNGHFTGKHTE